MAKKIKPIGIIPLSSSNGHSHLTKMGGEWGSWIQNPLGSCNLSLRNLMAQVKILAPGEW